MQSTDARVFLGKPTLDKVTLLSPCTKQGTKLSYYRTSRLIKVSSFFSPCAILGRNSIFFGVHLLLLIQRHLFKNYKILNLRGTKQYYFAPRRLYLVNCLLHYCYRNCNSHKIICDEFEQIKIMLSRNNYPNYVLDKCKREFFLS